MKKVMIAALLALSVFAVTACGTEQLQTEAQAAVDSYNVALDAYNEKATAYTKAVEEIEKANGDLQAHINTAQEEINAGENPYDPATLEELKKAMSSASSSIVSAPEAIASFEPLSMPEEAKADDLKALIEQATTGLADIEAAEVPDAPKVPDYTSSVQTLTDSLKAYKDSVQSMKQITAPVDSFVMERLQRVETITAMAPVTEDHDPNGKLNKQGGYIGCIYFTDSQVDRSQIYDDSDDVIEVGTDGGGAIEIFATPEEANARNDYLASFDGGMLSSGSHYVEGTCLIRTSDHLNGTQQKELTTKITEALIAIS